MAKQFNFTDINEIEEYAKGFNSTLNENLAELRDRERFGQKYEIYGESYDDFINIGTFYMNCSLKDCAKMDSYTGASAELAKTFSKYLVKYYDQGLTTDEIYDMLMKMKAYNEDLISEMRKAPMLCVFGRDSKGLDDRYGKHGSMYDFIKAFIADLKSEMKKSLPEHLYNRKAADGSTDIIDEFFDSYGYGEYMAVKYALQLFSDLRVGYGLDSTNPKFSNIVDTAGSPTLQFGSRISGSCLDSRYDADVTISNQMLEPVAINKTASCFYNEKYSDQLLYSASDGKSLADFRRRYTYYIIKNKSYNDLTSREETYRCIKKITTLVIKTTSSDSLPTGGARLYLSDGTYASTKDDSGNNLYYYMDQEDLECENEEQYVNVKNVTIPSGQSVTYYVSDGSLQNNYSEVDDPDFTSQTEYYVKLQKLDVDSLLTSLQTILNTSASNYAVKVKKYINATINGMKILYDIEPSGNANTSGIKLMASADEDNDTYQKALVTPFNLLNIPIMRADSAKWKSNLLDFDDDQYTKLTIESDDDMVYCISVGIIYKELNQYYRDELFSHHIDYILGVLSLDNKLITTDYVNRLVNPYLDKTIREMTVDRNHALLYDNNVLKYAINLYANNYIAIKSNELDIIRYFADVQSMDPELSFIGFGSISSEKEDIETFLELYSKVRKYYFARIMNKSFLNDALYGEFERFFLGTVAIERFISSRCINVRDINKFTETDVHNFLLSYGLESIDKSPVFTNQIEYKKKIIKEYNNLMKSKGSLSCLKKLHEIFSGTGDSLNLARYYLVGVADDDDPSSVSLRFIPCSYETDNITKELFDRMDEGKTYSSTVENDNYWSESLSESQILSNNINIIPTKYNLLNLVEDIKSKYFITQYLISLIRLVNTTLKEKNTADVEESILSTSIGKYVIENDEITGMNLCSLSEYMELLLDIYEIYMGLAYTNYASPTISTLDDDSIYYGFNIGMFSKTSSQLNDDEKNVQKYLESIPGDSLGLMRVNPEKFREIVLDENKTTVYGLDSNELLNNYLIGYNMLKIMAGENALENLTAYCKQLNNIDSNEEYSLDTNTLSNIVFTHLLEFPLSYMDGLQNQGVADIKMKYIDDSFISFTDSLFRTCYMSNVAPYVVQKTKGKTDDSLYNTHLDNLIKKLCGVSTSIVGSDGYLMTTGDYQKEMDNLLIGITGMSSKITDILAMDGKAFNLGMSSDSTNLLSFLIETFKIFLSYTSTLHETANIWDYDSQSEYATPYDYLETKSTYKLVDNNQYDEKVVVIKIPKQ